MYIIIIYTVQSVTVYMTSGAVGFFFFSFHLSLSVLNDFVIPRYSSIVLNQWNIKYDKKQEYIHLVKGSIVL